MLCSKLREELRTTHAMREETRSKSAASDRSVSIWDPKVFQTEEVKHLGLGPLGPALEVETKNGIRNKTPIFGVFLGRQRACWSLEFPSSFCRESEGTA